MGLKVLLDQSAPVDVGHSPWIWGGGEKRKRGRGEGKREGGTEGGREGWREGREGWREGGREEKGRE